MLLTSSRLRFLLSAAATVMFALSSAAAPITWAPASNISGDSDVSTLGTLVGAFNIGGTGVPNTTVNGVLFQGFALPTNASSATSGNFTFTAGMLDPFVSDSSYGSNSPPFSNLSPSYQTLLSSAAFVSHASFTLTISGLTGGTLYQFQWWDNNANGGALNQTTATTAPTSVTLVRNTGGLGQFATGTFLADAATETIVFTSPQFGPQINAFQLRVIPEPSTWMLLSAGALLLVRFRNTRAKRKFAPQKD